MGVFKKITKGTAGALWEGTGSVIRGPKVPKAETNVNAKNTTNTKRITPFGVFEQVVMGRKSPVEADITGRKDWGKKPVAPVKPKPPEKSKDDSIFKKRTFSTERERWQWLMDHRNEIYRSTTKRRITPKKFREFEEELFPKKFERTGGVVAQGGFVPQKIVADFEKKRFWQAKTPQERENIKEDVKIVKKMLGLDQTKK